MSRLGKVALDPTGRFLAVAEGGKVRLQELESGRDGFRLRQTMCAILCLAPQVIGWPQGCGTAWFAFGTSNVEKHFDSRRRARQDLFQAARHFRKVV
jgi:hypothetical protein